MNGLALIRLRSLGFLPEGLNVVERDLDGTVTVVDFADGVRAHVSLLIPCFLLSLF